jgi:hypothetical protein
MKRHFIQALLRLYPSQWRCEYGQELEDVLNRGPLNAHIAANVLWNGVRQRAAATEPWILLGVAWFLVSLLPWVQQGHALPLLHLPLFLGLGFWTQLRGGNPVTASLKLAAVGFVAASLGLLWLAPRYVFQAGSPSAWVAVLGATLAPTVIAGWLGGLAARAALRLRRG